ncbi:MAG: fatty acid desaturase [Pseudomonadota bacterium]
MRLEFPTLALILVAYGGWGMAGWWLYPISPVAGLLAMTLAAALHASLVHESCHGHPTRNARVNEALVTINPGLIWPYRRFRTMHLLHHRDDRITDPFDDPESYYRAAWWYDGLHPNMRAILGWSNTLVGRLVLGPPMSAFALMADDMVRIKHGDADVRRAWVLHFLGLVPIFLAVWAFAIPVWVYVLFVAWPAASIIMLRSFAEHRWHETPEGRTIIVEKSPLSVLFLNNNLHLVHHMHPGLAWYKLPALYRAEIDAWRQRNDGYVFSCYWALMKHYLFRAKEPVVHPEWRKTPDILRNPAE